MQLIDAVRYGLEFGAIFVFPLVAAGLARLKGSRPLAIVATFLLLSILLLAALPEPALVGSGPSPARRDALTVVSGGVMEALVYGTPVLSAAVVTRLMAARHWAWGLQVVIAYVAAVVGWQAGALVGLLLLGPVAY